VIPFTNHSLITGFKDIEDRNPKKDHTEMDNSKGNKNLLSSEVRCGFVNTLATEDMTKEMARSREKRVNCIFNDSCGLHDKREQMKLVTSIIYALVFESIKGKFDYSLIMS
jgi:hypothetical protein